VEVDSLSEKTIQRPSIQMRMEVNGSRLLSKKTIQRLPSCIEFKTNCTKNT